MLLSDMFLTQLYSNFLLGTWFNIFVFYVQCVNGNDITANDGLLVHVCEHNKQHLECEENSVIHLLKANYGRTSLTTCDQNHEGKWSVKCMNNNKTENIVRKKCNGKRSCDVAASNSVFGDPCAGTIKYLEVKYFCAPDTKPISTYVCEHNNLHMECNGGKRIHLLEANYGRTTFAKCTSYNLNWNLNCVSDKSSEKIIREKCDRKRACDVEAYNSIFGDPCPGTIKYVEMQYYCASDDLKVNTLSTEILNTETSTPEITTYKKVDEHFSIYACEGDDLHVKCEEGNVIQLLKANYGRSSLAKCDKNPNTQPNVNCINNKTEDIVRSMCNGKHSCKVAATNSVFGDPCYGTIKYLEMQYLCVPANGTISIHACEDNSLHLECKGAYGIRTLQANYGRTTLSKCDEKRAELWSVNCVSNNTEDIVKKVCHGKPSCNIEATNRIFGDPCFGTIKYLEMQYMCVSDSAVLNSEWNTPEETTPKHEPISIHVCEDDSLHVDCGNGKVIHLLKANYGRTTLAKCDQKYYKEWSVNCVNYNTRAIVEKKCDGKSSCDILASNSVFGDNCFGTIKYLEVQYLCSAEHKAISVSVCENDIIHAKCDSGSVIQLIQANYGRTSLAVCNSNNMQWNVNCISHQSEQVVKEKCNGKRRCDVAATNSVFGDSCYGTIKYLEMQYLCVPDEDATTDLNTIERTTYQATITNSEVLTETHHSTTGKINTIAISESPKSVSQTTQDIPITVTDVSNTQSYNPKTDSNNLLTVSDIPRTVSDYPRTTTDYPRTTTDYPETSADYHRTDTDYTGTDTDYTGTATDYPSTDTVYPSSTASDISSTISEVPKSFAAFTTAAIKYLTAKFPEVDNVPTAESSTELSASVHECSNYNLKCLNFECPKDFGSHLHPTNGRKMFIVCINWKPTIKECGRGLVVSEKLMKCVSENLWWSRWSDS